MTPNAADRAIAQSHFQATTGLAQHTGDVPDLVGHLLGGRHRGQLWRG